MPSTFRRSLCGLWLNPKPILALKSGTEKAVLVEASCCSVQCLLTPVELGLYASSRMFPCSVLEQHNDREQKIAQERKKKADNDEQQKGPKNKRKKKRQKTNKKPPQAVQVRRTRGRMLRPRALIVLALCV